LSPKDIGSLAFKLAGLYAIFEALALLSVLLSIGLPLLRTDESFLSAPMFVLGLVITTTLLLGFGSFLIGSSRRLAEATVLDSAAVAGAGVRSVDIHAVLFSVLGVFFVASVVTDLPDLIQSLYLSASEGGYGGPREFLAQRWPWAAGLALQSAIGLVLLLRARRLAIYFTPSEPAASTMAPLLRCRSCNYPYSPESYRQDARAHLCANCGTDLRHEEPSNGV